MEELPFFLLRLLKKKMDELKVRLEEERAEVQFSRTHPLISYVRPTNENELMSWEMKTGSHRLSFSIPKKYPSEQPILKTGYTSHLEVPGDIWKRKKNQKILFWAQMIAFYIREAARLENFFFQSQNFEYEFHLCFLSLGCVPLHEKEEGEMEVGKKMKSWSELDGDKIWYQEVPEWLISKLKAEEQFKLEVILIDPRLTDKVSIKFYLQGRLVVRSFPCFFQFTVSSSFWQKFLLFEENVRSSGATVVVGDFLGIFVRNCGSGLPMNAEACMKELILSNKVWLFSHLLRISPDHQLFPLHFQGFQSSSHGDHSSLSLGRYENGVQVVKLK